jgi:hypothetical protein
MWDPAKSDGTRTVPDGTFDDPTFLPRLSWRSNAPAQIAAGQLAESIAGSGDVAFFCDNNYSTIGLIQLSGMHCSTRLGDS